MRFYATKRIIALTVAVLSLNIATSAHASAPIKEILATHYGWEVDETTKANVCVVKSADQCQPGKESGEPLGFQNPTDVAIGSSEAGENIYVADDPNQRIQEITREGRFVAMMGKEVNETKDNTTGATSVEKNICTQVEIESTHVKCEAGKEGEGSGEFEEPTSVIVDRGAHRLYVLDRKNRRIQEFTEDGQFVLMFGKKVDQTTGANVCTAESGDTCKGGEASPAGGSEPGVFNFNESPGAQLAFSEEQQLLYVGDVQRVQEFEPEGTFRRNILLPAEAAIRSLAAGPTGQLDVVYATAQEEPRAIHQLDATGQQVNEVVLAPRHASAVQFAIDGIALDSTGRIAISEQERLTQISSIEYFGALFGESTTEFNVTNGNDGGMAFDAQDSLYLAVVSEAFEVLSYNPTEVAEVKTSPGECQPGTDSESDATFACVFKGEVNPEDVPETEVWFEWASSSGQAAMTPVQKLCSATCGKAPATVTTTVEGIPPNESIGYRLLAFDQVVKPPEAALTGQSTQAIDTGLVAPRLMGAPTAEFVKRASAVLFAELNPENAETHYRFEYAPVDVCTHLEGCVETAVSVAQKSSAYARIGASAEVTGLQPGTTYAFRLVAESENSAKTQRAAAKGEGEQEATFTTTAPVEVQATTGASSAVGATTATITGTVNPDGQIADYSFELGLDEGQDTKYGVVESGAVGPSVTPIEETLALSGLQPGASYRYRIAIRYGDGALSGWAAVGESATFVTGGLPEVLASPGSVPILRTPAIEFPKNVVHTKKHTEKKKTKRKKRVKAGKHRKVSKVRR